MISKRIEIVQLSAENERPLLQIKDMELEMDEEKRRHAETVKILRKKERQIKEIFIQTEEDHKNLTMLQEALDKANQKISIYKRQLSETASIPSLFHSLFSTKQNLYS